MKRDAELAALNSNYVNGRVRCLLMSHELLWGLDMWTELHVTVSIAEVSKSQKIHSNPSNASKWGEESDTSHLDEYTPATLLFPFFFCPEISAASPQRSGKGEREWWGPLLRRVDYLMKGNQLERYGGLWTFIHLAWPLLSFHDGLWLFRGRDQS